MFSPVCVSHDTSTHQVQDFGSLNPIRRRSSISTDQPLEKTKRNARGNPVRRRSSISTDQPLEKTKRNARGNPDLDVEVVALSPDRLTATDSFYCEMCNKGFTRDQNLQLHKRGHNLPWKLKPAKNWKEMKRKKYVCPEPTCIHHHPSKALGDITGIKKHFLRKHYVGDKKWKCEKCSKLYAVEGDWKAHSKICCTKENQCDSGTLSSRKESFVAQKIFYDSLVEEHTKLTPYNHTNSTETNLHFNPLPPPAQMSFFPFPPSYVHGPEKWDLLPQNPNLGPRIHMNNYEKPHMMSPFFENSQYAPTSTLPPLLTRPLLQEGATVGAMDSITFDMHPIANIDPFTENFLGMVNHCGSGNVDRDEGSGRAEVVLNYGDANYQPPDHSYLFPIHQGFDHQSTAYTWRNYG